MKYSDADSAPFHNVTVYEGRCWRRGQFSRAVSAVELPVDELSDLM